MNLVNFVLVLKWKSVFFEQQMRQQQQQQKVMQVCRCLCLCALWVMNFQRAYFIRSGCITMLSRIEMLIQRSSKYQDIERERLFVCVQASKVLVNMAQYKAVSV